MRQLLQAVVPLLLVGCMKPAATSSASSRQNLTTAREALVSAGYRCKSLSESKSSLVCEQEDPHVKFVFGFEEQPARMVVVLVFNYPTACDPQRYVRMNVFNGRVDYAHASCEGKNLFYFGSTMVPAGGLGGKDIVDYVHWWTKATIQAGAAAGLFEEGGGHPSPSEDGTKT